MVSFCAENRLIVKIVQEIGALVRLNFTHELWANVFVALLLFNWAAPSFFYGFFHNLRSYWVWATVFMLWVVVGEYFAGDFAGFIIYLFAANCCKATCGTDFHSFLRRFLTLKFISIRVLLATVVFWEGVYLPTESRIYSDEHFHLLREVCFFDFLFYLKSVAVDGLWLLFHCLHVDEEFVLQHLYHFFFSMLCYYSAIGKKVCHFEN